LKTNSYAACLLGAVMTAGIGHAAARGAGDVPIVDTRVFPENIAAAPDGTLWIGSIGRAAIYRALPNERTATPWIAPGAHGLKRVMGLYHDSSRNLLWVCDAGERSAEGGKGAASIRTFDPATAAQQTRFPFEAQGGCNDLTIATDGTVYVSDFENARIFRLKPDERTLTPWLADERLVAVDGLAFLGDGALYVNTFREGGLYRIAVNPDGSAGSPVRLTLSQPLERPDAMRTIAPHTLLVAEGGGKISTVTVRGDQATVRVVRAGLTDGPAAAVLVGNTVYAVQAKFAKMRDPALDPGEFVVLAIPLR
jgi:sugar lactone lactonase YvrE